MQIDEARYWIKSSIYDENSLQHALLAAETLTQHDPHLGVEVELDELRQLAKLPELSESQLDKGEAMRESIELSIVLWSTPTPRS